MFLTETNLYSVVKKQYYYKLKAYRGLFFNLIVVQLIALLFSFSSGVQQMSLSSEQILLSLKTFSSDIIIIFTLIWAFIIAMQFTTKEYRNIDFTFVSNQVSSNLSNIALLVTTSLAGGVTAILGGALLRVICYFSENSHNIISQNFFLVPQDLFVGVLATTLYIMLLSALGYFFGMLVQINKALVFLLPTIFFGLLLFEARLNADPVIFLKIVQFFSNEVSIGLFTIKVIVIVSMLFYSAMLISNRMEVRK